MTIKRLGLNSKLPPVVCGLEMYKNISFSFVCCKRLVLIRGNCGVLKCKKLDSTKNLKNNLQNKPFFEVGNCIPFAKVLRFLLLKRLSNI